VILVKFVVSPYSPINAYFAVMLQCTLGYFLFFRGFNKFSPIILGFLSLLFSGIQKIVILTLVFGMTLWESLDIFFEFVLNRILPNYQSPDEISISYILVGIYILTHILGGLVAGWYASILPARIRNHTWDNIELIQNNFNDLLNMKIKKKKRKNWWLKPSSIAFFIFAIFLIAISFFYDEVDKNIAGQVVVMILRSILIIVIWYYFISPLLLKLVNKILSNKSKKQANEIENIVQLFPNIKSIIKYSWSQTKSYRGTKRIFFFIDKVLISYLLFEQ